MCYIKSESTGGKTETPCSAQKQERTEIKENVPPSGSQSHINIAIVGLVSTKEHHLSQ